MTMSLPIEELTYVQNTLGTGAEVARYIGVERPAVSRWQNGKDRPSGENEARIVALRLVILKLRAIYEDDVILPWLTATNPLLNNQRPVELMAQGRTTEVMSAIDQARAGSFA